METDAQRKTSRLIAAEPKWKRFERTVLSIHERYASPGTLIRYDDKIFGEQTLRKRQIDVSIRTMINGSSFLMVVECKDTGRPIDSAEMGAFASLLEDIAANKGVLVSRGGFTQGALNLALRRKIDTQLYTEVDLPPDAAIYAMSDVCRLAWKLELLGINGFEWIMPSADTASLQVFDLEKRSLGLMVEVARRAWNECAIPEENGEYPILISEHLLVQIEDRFIHAKAVATVKVDRHRYYGPIAAQRLALVDAASRKPIFNRTSTEMVKVSEVFSGTLPGWIEVLPDAILDPLPMQIFVSGGGWDRSASPGSEGKTKQLVPENAVYVELFAPTNVLSRG